MKSLQNWYLEQTKQNNLVYDENQNDILQHLDIFINNFNNLGFFSNLFGKFNSFGIYLYGDVGRGKSMIINEMYNQINTPQKIRIHFYQFMHDIHQKLASLKKYENPLRQIAKELRQKYKIIFLDEMHVNDIATAMILKNLLNSLFANKVFIVTSSNYAPNELYPDGLMRERFLDAIKLINTQLEVLSLNSPTDYRLIHELHNKMFIFNAPDQITQLDRLFKQFAQGDIAEKDQIITLERPIEYQKKCSNMIWFKFDIICGSNRSALDYLEISQQFEYIIIEDVQAILPQEKDIARRLTVDSKMKGNYKTARYS